MAASFLGQVLMFLQWFFDRIQYHNYTDSHKHSNFSNQIKLLCIIILFPSTNMSSAPKIYITTALDDKNQQLKLYTVFYNLPQTDHLKPDHLLAQIHVLTENRSYEAKLKRKNINNQLAWNYDLINRLENVLAGVLNNVFIKIQERGFKNLVLIAANQFEMRSIRVTLFEAELNQLSQLPYNLMRTLMENLHIQRQQTINDLKRTSEAEKQKISQIDQYSNQIQQNHKDQVSSIKDRFLPVINQCKKKLIKCFGLDPNLQIGRLIDLENDSGQIIQRRIFKIKGSKINAEELEQNQKNKQKIDVQQLFD